MEKINERVRKCIHIITMAMMGIIALILIFTIHGHTTEAKEIIVDASGNGEYSRIQYAIENASEGDRILVWDGTYQENILVNKQVTIKGNGSETTIINGSDEGSVVNLTANGIIFEGFRIIASGSGLWDAGIKVTEDDCIIRRNNCTGNTYGIYCNSSGNTLETNYFVDNDQYGIYLSYGGHNQITENFCEGNFYYGIRVSISNENFISENTCMNNSVGIEISSSEENALIKNTCQMNDGAGIRLAGSDRNTIRNNNCSENGNGISIWLYSYDNTVELNTCQNNSNGISLQSSCINMITNNTFCWNDDGIDLSENSHGNTIQTNSLFLNKLTGIFIKESNNCLISGNILLKNSEGMYIRLSHNTNINNNTCLDNYFQCIALSSSDSNVVENNTLGTSMYGVMSSRSILNSIHSNICYDNMFGIWFSETENNTISDNIIINNTSSGIWVSKACWDAILNNSISLNPTGIYVRFSSHNISINRNNITGNPDYGVEVHSVVNINATNNWWGSFLGPFHPTENPEGLGDNVSDLVLFDPWIIRKTLPVILSEDIQDAFEDIHYYVMYEASDADGDELMWSLITNASFLHLDTKTDVISGTPRQENVGAYFVNISVSDGENRDHHNFSLNVHQVNDPPVITTENIQQTMEDDEYSVPYEAQDEEDDILIWSLSSNADFLEINPNSGILTGVPGQDDLGIYWVNVSVSDGFLPDYQNFTLQVININDKPVVSITYPQDMNTVEDSIIITGTSYDVDNQIQKIEIRIDQEDWQEAEGTDTWNHHLHTKELENGLHNIYVRAFDGYLHSIVKVITVNVFNTIENIKPTITITSPENGSTISGLVSVQGIVTDDNGEIVKVEISIDGGSWFQISGTDMWSYEWDTEDSENREYRISVRTFDGEVYSDEIFIVVKIENKEEDTDDSQNAWFILLVFGVLFVFMISVFFMKVRDSESDEPQIEIYMDQVEPICENDELTGNNIESLKGLKKDNYCEICGMEMKYIAPLGRWYCIQCKEFSENDSEYMIHE